jgi:hypothetical protein
VHAPAGEVNKEQHVESLEPDRVDGEEIHGDCALRLRPEELPPGRARSLARRTQLFLAEHLPLSEGAGPRAGREARRRLRV